MTNRRKSLEPFLYLLLLIMLSACNDNSQSKRINATDATQPIAMQCLELQSQCDFELADGRAQVLFDVKKIIAEQAFNMSINYTGANRIKTVSGYMEGVEMFMGKIPVFLEPALAPDKRRADKIPSIQQQTSQHATAITQQVFLAELLVGSCSAEQMTWKLWLTFTMADNQTQTKMLTIVSYRS